MWVGDTTLLDELSSPVERGVVQNNLDVGSVEIFESFELDDVFGNDILDLRNGVFVGLEVQIYKEGVLESGDDLFEGVLVRVDVPESRVLAEPLYFLLDFVQFGLD